jgi:hypothetical protein
MADLCWPMRSYLSRKAASWWWICVDQWEATFMGWQPADGGFVLTSEKLLALDGKHSWWRIRVDQWEATCLGWQPADGAYVLTNEKLPVRDGNQLMVDPCWPVRSYLFGIADYYGPIRSILIVRNSGFVITNEKHCFVYNMLGMEESCWPMRSIVTCLGFCVVERRVGIVSHV